MAHPRLTGTRTLLTAGVALTALVVPFGSAAFAQGLETSGLDEDIDEAKALLDDDGDEQEEGLDDAVEEALTELLGSSESDGDGATAPSDDGREMEGAAGGEMTPVEEPDGAASQPAPQPAQAQQQPGESQAPAAGRAAGGYASGPRLQQWFSRTAPTLDHFAGPLVSAPLVVPAPAYAEAATVAGLTPTGSDELAMVTTPLSANPNPYTPTEWPLAVAAGMLLLVAGGHVLRLYDRRWKASLAQATSGPYVTSTD